MRLALMILAALIALAANSVLIRLAVVEYGADPAAFGVVRVAAGAMALALLMWGSGRRWPPMATGRRLAGAGMLALYVAGFSLAYRTLDAGLGALLLFGAVQMTVFAVVVARGEAVPPRRWIGAGIAFAGLLVLLWPGGTTGHVALRDALAMLVAGGAWGIYTLLGRGGADPVPATAANFVLALPLVLPLWALAGHGLSFPALGLAVTSGAVTSGLGYVLFYSIVARIDATLAGIAQLSVPVIATLGGLALIGEPVTLRLVLAGAMVLGGIGFSIRRGGAQRRIGSSGS
ncbi:MAG: EamA family transporter [Limimaricola sp.]|uniref:DMT family transporter n=1 Tax=Limimaricola sp. TaxID=2211665 RepID=UPI001DA03873|nr:DMT family transporter [Limimaricola sp.]MBI1417813.1 EamA family transporter [Limimaricola sp.]